jgi:hypothetical protein
LAEAVAEKDLDKIELLLASMLADPDVGYVAIHSQSEDSMLASYGERTKIDNALLQHRTINMVEGMEIVHVGDIELGLSKDDIKHHITAHIQAYLVAFVILIFTFFFCDTICLSKLDRKKARATS